MNVAAHNQDTCCETLCIRTLKMFPSVILVLVCCWQTETFLRPASVLRKCPGSCLRPRSSPISSRTEFSWNSIAVSIASHSRWCRDANWRKAACLRQPSCRLFTRLSSSTYDVSRNVARGYAPLHRHQAERSQDVGCQGKPLFVSRDDECHLKFPFQSKRTGERPFLHAKRHERKSARAKRSGPRYPLRGSTLGKGMWCTCSWSRCLCHFFWYLLNFLTERVCLRFYRQLFSCSPASCVPVSRCRLSIASLIRQSVATVPVQGTAPFALCKSRSYLWWPFESDILVPSAGNFHINTLDHVCWLLRGLGR